jgi:hypothetical protein
MMKLHSSRRNRLDQAVLNQRLGGAVSYDRIAGYFRSSLFEVAGEAIAKVTGPVRIICNSDLDPQDLVTAAAAQAALRRSWCSGRPEEAPPSAIPRYRALYEALTSKKMEVRVLPDSAFGLIHGKAGVVRHADGSAIAFLGSVNESASAWKMNYELLWEDDDPAAIAWVQEEFDALWNDARAVDLACCPFIAQDVQRIISRRVIEPEDVKAIADTTTAAAAAAVETPVSRHDQGLMPHQKYFARLALDRHRLGGARLVLADQVEVRLRQRLQLALGHLLGEVGEEVIGARLHVVIVQPDDGTAVGRVDHVLVVGLAQIDHLGLGQIVIVFHARSYAAYGLLTGLGGGPDGSSFFACTASSRRLSIISLSACEVLST